MSHDVMHVPVTERISDEFLTCLEKAFASANDVATEDLYLSSGARDGIPISYSEPLKPFVGQTHGYNPPDDRVYLNEDNFLLRAIREALTDVGRRGTGARVFLTSDRAYCLDDGEKLTLVTWDWPGEDLEEDVSALAEKVEDD